MGAHDRRREPLEVFQRYYHSGLDWMAVCFEGAAVLAVLLHLLHRGTVLEYGTCDAHDCLLFGDAVDED